MTDSPEIKMLVDAPLRFAEIEVTPGWQHLHVVDRDTNTLVNRVTMVDCDAGMAWCCEPPSRRSTERPGNYKLVCSAETLERFKEQWKSLT